MIGYLAELSNIGNPELKDGYKLDSLALEKEMVYNNGGIDLSNIDTEHLGPDRTYKKLVPHFSKHGWYLKEDVLSTANKYPEIKKPCSMSLESLDELASHMATGYQVSHFHYILGRKHNLKGSFPHFCCGLSSRNVMLSLIELGYPNATYAYSDVNDHGYVLLPFVFEKENINGSIVIDPTYDQLWNKPAERNAVFVKLGSVWEYKTDWANKGDLYPTKSCSIATLRKIPKNLTRFRRYHRGGESFFRKAFSNPVKLEKT